ncbi:nuclear transport factor 2 family protein [Dietzia sp. SLG310A2-38A2]|uniref:nuclear transport factor 2 family protein n=1 Tax=Dietzia sp. SLG310A2-38A2 TaxID=1630643 RepID=UPI0015FE4F82|nr:nuclear transport factor 2 family protein [Dietzia sp. SLG310A2-38A2]MBB1030269.1 nuclear transport factor 2 family protein [Dietzia sp. SLG310A2-38A2]
MSRTLVELSDRWDLQDLVTRYATCIDARDFDGLDRVFTPDARVSYEASGGPADHYPAVRAWLAEMLPIFASTQHLMGNLAVTLDGDTATGRCMCFNPMALGPVEEKDQQVFFYGLWYVLGFVRTAEGWRIDRLAQEQAFHHNVP